MLHPFPFLIYELAFVDVQVKIVNFQSGNNVSNKIICLTDKSNQMNELTIHSLKINFARI